MTKSTTIVEIAKALVKFQKAVKPVKKEAENPFFKSKYADLASIIEAIKDPMADNGLSFSQFPTGQNQLTTILMHESGEWLEDTYTVAPVDNRPQSVGSAITYARRYALGAILGIATESDDDGAEASGTVAPQATRTVTATITDGRNTSKPTIKTPGAKATEAQKKLVFVLLRELGKTQEGLEKWLLDVHKITGMENLTKGIASELIENMKKTIAKQQNERGVVGEGESLEEVQI